MAGNFQMEFRSWQKKLDILQHENLLLKNQVTELLKKDVDPGLLEKVEHYLTCFLEKDAVLALLRHEIAAEMRGLGHFAQDETAEDMEARLATLRRDIVQMEYEFYKLKLDFTNYLFRLTAAA